MAATMGSGNPYQDLMEKQQRQQQTAQSTQPAATEYARNVSGDSQRANTPAVMSAAPQAGARGILGGLGGLITGIVGGIASSISGGGGSKPSSTSGGGTSSSSSGSNRPQGTGTTYIDPTGKEQNGYIINGQTYKDPYGQNRVDVGSKVQTGNGWYQLGADGKGVAIQNPYGSGGSGGGSGGGTQNWGTQEKPLAMRYWDASGKPQIGYMIGGQMYVDQGGTQRIGVGSRVQTGGGWYEMTANGGVKVPGFTQTTIEDAYGNKSYAFIGEDGRTYLDPQMTQRVPVGTVVQTANGKYVMTENGGVPITDAEIERQRVNRIMQQRKQETINAINAATEAGVLAYEQMLPGINSQYDQAAKQLYTNYRQESQALPEQMAKMGLYGQGVSESTAAGLSNNYQAGLNNSELARRSAIQQVKNDIAKLRAEAQSQIAKATADLSGEQFEAWKWLQQMEEQRKQQEWEKQIWEKEFGMAQTEEEYNRQLEAAKLLAQYGDFSGYKALGFNDAQIAGMEQKYLEELQAEAYSAMASSSGGRRSASRSTGSKKSSGTKSSSFDYDGLFAAAKASGNPKSYIANNYKRFGFSSNTGLYDDYKNWTNRDKMSKYADAAAGALTQVGNAGSGMGYSFQDDLNYVKKNKITVKDVQRERLDLIWIDAYGQQKYRELLAAATKNG